MSNPAAIPAVIKPRPYRRYLTSALHSRFVRAALLALLNGLVISFCTGNDFFWSWFPFGPAGLKAVLFCMSSLFIFILQLATLIVGRRTSTSLFSFLRKTVFDFSTYQTLLWYTISAWWFCEAFIWSVPEKRHLGWIVRGDETSLDRLNERPIYLRFFFTILAFVQAGVHLYYGDSFLHIPVAGPATPQDTDHRTHPINPVTFQLQRKAQYMVRNGMLCSGITTILAPFIYKAFFRDLFWRIHLAFAKPFFNLSRSDARPPDNYFIGSILLTAFVIGAILSLSWELSAHSFLMYIKQEPVKNGFPLTGASQDPNGTLLNGLNAKRDIVKTFAFWELAIIAQKFPDRRKAIFADFDRPTGPMWSAMYGAALRVISSIDDRIVGLSSSSEAPPQQPQITSLPKIASDPRPDSVFAAPPATSLTKTVVNFLVVTTPKSLGESKEPWHPPIEKTKQQLIEYTKNTASQHKGALEKWSDLLSTSPIGGFLHIRTSSKINSVILGDYAGNAAIIVDAIESVTKMLIASLNEDNYGKVVQTVPSTVKQFTRTLQMIESYVSNSAQTMTSADKIELDEVIVIVERLKAGLQELLSAFQVFLNDAGLSIQDLNAARRASEATSIFSEQKQPTEQPEKEKLADAPKQRELGSGTEQKKPQEKNPERRTAERQPRRIESGSRRQQKSDGNVFGARDFNSEPTRRREMQQVR